MFHLASAIFWTFVQPLGLLALFLVLALVFIVLRRQRLALFSGGAALLILLLSAWTTLGALLLHPLESRFEKPQPDPQSVDGIIVLGGGLEGAINLARGGHEMNASGDRFIEAIMLAHKFPDARIVISGGHGSVFLEGEDDASAAARLFRKLGVEPSRLILEGRSRDTFENALFSKEKANPQPGENWLLVTSAFHMPRAMSVFAKVDFPVVPWPVDYKTAGTERFGLTQDNALDSLRNVTLATREWIGLAAYYHTGRTEAFLPSGQSNSDE